MDQHLPHGLAQKCLQWVRGYRQASPAAIASHGYAGDMIGAVLTALNTHYASQNVNALCSIIFVADPATV